MFPYARRIALGEIIEKEGSLFGSSINKTARILSLAKQDEILCSLEFVQMLPKQIDLTMEEVGNFQFKNLMAETRIYSIKHSKSKEDFKGSVIDPVCKMIIGNKDINLKTVHQGVTYHFCSTDCKALFEKESQKFIDYN